MFCFSVYCLCLCVSLGVYQLAGWIVWVPWGFPCCSDHAFALTVGSESNLAPWLDPHPHYLPAAESMGRYWHTKAHTHTSHHSQQPGTSVLKCHCLFLFLTCILQPKVERERERERDRRWESGSLVGVTKDVCVGDRGTLLLAVYGPGVKNIFHANTKTFLCFRCSMHSDTWILHIAHLTHNPLSLFICFCLYCSHKKIFTVTGNWFCPYNDTKSWGPTVLRTKSWSPQFCG